MMIVFPFTLTVIVLYHRLIFIDTDFHTLKLKAEDSYHRQHVFTVKLKSKVRGPSKLIFHNLDHMHFFFNYSS